MMEAIPLGYILAWYGKAYEGKNGIICIREKEKGCHNEKTKVQRRNGIEGSMSAPGCLTIPAWRTFGHIEERIDISAKTRYNERTKEDLYRYIFNRKCLHSTLGYMIPVACRLVNT